LRLGRRRRLVAREDVEIADRLHRGGLGRRLDPVGQVQDLVVGGVRLGGAIRPRLGRRGVRGRLAGALGLVVLRDDPPDGGQDFLHRRFLVGVGHRSPRAIP
jgi:hypothetical protein